MPRETVVARFTSFGHPRHGHGGRRGAGVEMVAMNGHGNSSTNSLDQLAPEHFPPLPSRPVMVLAHDLPKPRRAPLFHLDQYAEHGMPSNTPGKFLGPMASHSPSMGTPSDPGHAPVMQQDEQQVALEAALAEKEAEVAALRLQLEAVRAEKDSAVKRKAEAKEAAGLAHSAHAQLQDSFAKAVDDYRAYKAQASQRLLSVHESVLELLAVVQQQGYEVASGLDALQDDLVEAEAVMVESRRTTQMMSDGNMADASAPQGPTTVTVHGDGMIHSMPGHLTQPIMGSMDPTLSTPPPKGGGLQDMNDVEGSLPDISPNTEKMVILKARREHVETSFLELMRCCVTELEKLATVTCLTPSISQSSGGSPKLSQPALPSTADTAVLAVAPAR